MQPSRDVEPEDHAENALRAFFRSERPKHFPPASWLSAPARSERRSGERSPLSRSRVLLLGCVAVVMGLWLLLGPLARSSRSGAGLWKDTFEARQQKPHEKDRPAPPR
jgi:hypothetical protein